MTPQPDPFDLVQFEARLVAARFERANTHFESFAQTWDTYLARKPHAVVRDRPTPDGVIVVRLKRHDPFPVELSIEFGELLYELRAALDNALYAVAVIASGKNPPPGASSLEWPIFEKASDWKSKIRKIKTLPAELVSELEAIQPYNAEAPGWNGLALLHNLARLDRHRSPHRLDLYLSHLSIQVDESQIEILDIRPPGIIQEDDELVRVQLGKGVELTPLNFDINFEFEVEATDVAEAPGPGGEEGRPWGSLDDRLRVLIEVTRQYAIDLIERAGTR